VLHTISSSYKRSVCVVDDRQQLEKVCKLSSSSFKFANNGKCNMLVIFVGWQLLQNGR
jgi:hypothetical protein